MGWTGLAPWTNRMRLDGSSTMRAHQYADRFSVVRVETVGPLADTVRKSSCVPALLVSVFVRPVAPPAYRLWVDGGAVPTGSIPAFHANVIDFDAEPSIWGAGGVDHVHFHIRRGTIDETAADLGYERVGAFRLSVAQDDIVLAQIAKNTLPHLGSASGPRSLALDQLELILAAHLIQRYSAAKPRRAVVRSGLAAWQRRRATDLLRENLDRSVRLADVASACELSVSHFARSFKTSFGVSCHRWLTDRRIDHAKELLAATDAPLVDVCQFAASWDQRVRRVMGPGRRIKTTGREGAAYRSRRRSIFRWARAPRGAPAGACGEPAGA